MTKYIIDFARINFTAMYSKVISLLIENFDKNIITTKRDIFYQDVSLFQSQKNVDMIIEALCRSLGFTNQELGAVAAQKGLCYGEVTLKSPGGSSQVFTRKQGSFLIPRIGEKTSISVPDDTEYILIVEKDAVFNLLCDALQKRIIITGKGFPDHLTRRFLNLLSESFPKIPVLGVADVDPYGINIMKQFKTGGDKSNCYLVNKNQGFDCPRLKLIDVTILEFTQKLGSLDLSIRDFMISSKMLEGLDLILDRDLIEYERWKKELQRSMFLGKKSEIDIIKEADQESSDLAGYINASIKRRLNRMNE